MDGITMIETGQTDKQTLISLTQAAETYGFSQAYLANLARNGRLRARKLGSIWVTTPADVETYIRSRKKVGLYRDDVQLDE